MMTKKGLFSVLILCAFFASAPVFAIPNISGTDATVESNPIDVSGTWNLDWSYVYKFRESTAVAVDSYWILTAAHVADDTWASGTITIGETTYTPVETNYYNGTVNGSSSVSDVTADLALVRVNKALPGYYDYATSVNSYNGDDVIVVGYGRAGVVTQNALTPGSWTSVTGDNAKRWGTNNINGTTSKQDDFGNTYGMYYTSISATSSSIVNGPNTAFETGLNINDSGGPMFAKDGDEWVVVGINAYVGNEVINFVSQPATYSVPVGSYSDWIANVTLIPEPVTLGLLAAGATVVALRRRRR